MIKRALAISLTVMTVAIGVPQLASTQSVDPRLGKVHFQTSCNSTAQPHFDRAMLYQHSFWYRASQRAFEETLKADPECAIAHWGIALSLLFNPHTPPPPANLPMGLASLEKGKALAVKTQRERDYLDALSAMYADYEKVPHNARVENYLKAMEQLAQRYPDDDEAQIHYALTLNVGAPLSDKTYAYQLKGAGILEKINLRQPQHPGVVHYLIHLYDYPPIAERGINAARRYAQVAPDAPHALHMPSHIFTRVGYWKESIASNMASAKAAKDSKEFDEQLHAMDYLVYAYLQRGEDSKVGSAVEEMAAVTAINPRVRAGPYALAASPARHMIERGDWKGAAELQVRPSQFAYVDAMSHFARAVGAARLGNVAAANGDITKLAELREKLATAKDLYWAEQVDIQWQVAQAWLLSAHQQHDDALKTLSAAADAEDKTEKHVVTPGVPKPARELYGDMLLERGKAAEALAAYEATLAKEPNRLGAYIGAARSAQSSGDAAKARHYYAKAVELTADAEPVRTEIAEARAFMAKAN